MIIDSIRNKYQGNIRLCAPQYEIDELIPKPLRELLMQSNGITETMTHPKTGELMDIGWIQIKTID